MAEGVNVTGTTPVPTPDPTDASQVAQMVVTVAIFVVGIPLNGLVVWVLGVRGGRREGHSGEEPRGAGTFRTYVVHLALADLVLVLRIPLMLGYLAAGYRWPFGLAACRLVMFLRGLGLYANAFLLCAISTERCLCLMRPVWFRLRRPRWTVLLVCALLWLLAGALSVPYLSTSALVGNRTQCHESSGNSTLGLLITETTVGFLLPLLLFLTTNLVVLLTARRAGGSGAASASTPTPKRLVRLYRVLFLTMLLFLTCWVPYFTFRFLLRLAVEESSVQLTKVSYIGVYISLYLVYLKSALNPVIYVFAARGLGRTIRASIFSTVDRIFNEETSDYARRRSLRRTDSQF
ncbi:C5a anaphylatoxin chemotactic receptor 1 [Conger conger]|nr:C5a anaphylatoxin chemotactic receptor 1 [Conger conger]XP_061092465.1 C5a anaphylatoxin chemotactic receptor 1 [Conger conger]